MDLEYFTGTTFFGIFAMLITGASWCLTGFIMGKAPKMKMETSVIQIFSYFASLMIGSSLLVQQGLPKGETSVIVWTCLAYAICGAMNFIMLQIMSYAMQRGPNGIIWTIIQSALIFPFMFSVLAHNVELTYVRIFGLFSLILSLVLFGCAKDNSNSKGGWLIPAFICFSICAVQQTIQTEPSYYESARCVNSVARTVSGACGSFITALIYNLVRITPDYVERVKATLLNRALWKLVFAMQLFSLVFSYALLYPGMNAMADNGLGGMCYPLLVGSCIISFSLVSCLILKEKLQPKQRLAMLCCLLGLICVCTKFKG